jgi:predicted nucleic acid-binding protein
VKIYADTSALVKRYFCEVGTEVVADLLRNADLVATSRVAFAEAAAAVARRAREGALGSRQRDRVLDRLARDFERIAVVDVTERVAQACRDLVVRHPLRGFDCIHLSSALLVAGDHRSDWTFLCSDKPLLDSAAAEGLSPLDPVED